MKTYTIEETAKILGVSTRSVYYAIKRGSLVAQTPPSGEYGTFVPHSCLVRYQSERVKALEARLVAAREVLAGLVG